MINISDVHCVVAEILHTETLTIPWCEQRRLFLLHHLDADVEKTQGIQ